MLLISSRETKRWVVPKGWPIQGMEPWESACREAYEEAGVAGQATRRPLGRFHYPKRLRDGTLRDVVVEVFPLEVMVQHPTWPEQGERTLKWCLAAEAADMVQEPELATLIRDLKP